MRRLAFTAGASLYLFASSALAQNATTPAPPAAPPLAAPPPQAAPNPAGTGPAIAPSNDPVVGYRAWLAANETTRRSTGMMVVGILLLGFGATAMGIGTGVYA